MIKEGFEARRVLLTGVTGFLGTAVLERLLGLPVARVDVVIRGDAQERLKGVLAGSAFGPLKKRLGEDRFEALVAEKVRAIRADLSVAAPRIEDDVDIVIHPAAAVTFDPPIEDAFNTNLLGTTRLYEAAGGRPFVHVSTAYVAGVTRGIQTEEVLKRDIDWRIETDVATRLRDGVELDSRSPSALERFAEEARRELGRAGPQSVARRSEELRREWVTKEVSRSGTARARSLGWPDVYAFTKALTEMALDEIAAESSVAIVRPSIIESAWRHPYPGWIQGFRMADPIMLAFGRGVLPEFPGIPEGVVDMIPVDLVVNCILAVAARPPERRGVFHVSSGGRNPLSFRELYELTREYFLEKPLPERGRGFYAVPEWTFPGTRAVNRKLELAERGLGAAEKIVRKLPRGSFARDRARQVDRFKRRLDFARRYATLYGPYADAEVIYTDDRARALWESLPEDERDEYNFDPTSFGWREYLQEVHLPAIAEPLRWPVPYREPPRVDVRPNGAGSAPVLAVFDVEGTIVSSNVLEAYLWLRLSELDPVDRVKAIAALAARVPGLVKAERRDRGEFLRRFYRLYRGVGIDDIEAAAEESMADLVYRRLAPGAVRRIRRHRSAGHRVILITGTLEFVVAPLRALVDEIVAARLKESDGRFTGDLERPPVTGEARSSWLQERARQIGADLSDCYAYADSLSDLPLLESVGNPVAVNPDVPLARVARARSWPIEEWDADPGTPKIMLPELVR